MNSRPLAPNETAALGLDAGELADLRNLLFGVDSGPFDEHMADKV